MKRKEYSAGCVSKVFWFMEFKQVVKLLNAGKSFEEIRGMALNENLFGTSTERRAKDTYSSVASRVKVFNENLYEVFLNSDVATQKLIVLISIIATDTLFFDFMYEVLREKYLMSSEVIEEKDYRIFFKNKQSVSEKVAGWGDHTIDTLGKTYQTYLIEAGIITGQPGDKAKTLIRPIIDDNLVAFLKDNDLELIVAVFGG